MEIRTIVNSFSNPLSKSSEVETMLFKNSRKRRKRFLARSQRERPDRIPLLRAIRYVRSVIAEGSTDTSFLTQPLYTVGRFL